MDSLEQAILKLRSIKQRAVPTHLVELHQTAEDRPKSRQEERKRHLKAQGKRDQNKKKKASGRGTVPEEGENCLLCDKHHSTQSCRFLRKCHKLLIDKFKTSKDETAAVAEESKDSTEDDICFMVHEDLTGTSSTTDISDIPDYTRFTLLIRSTNVAINLDNSRLYQMRDKRQRYTCGKYLF